MIKKRIELQAGIRYRGYGYINNFGEFEFTPEQTGSRQGKRRLVKEGDYYTISETTGMRIFHITLPKELSGTKLVMEFLKVVNDIISVLRNYEI